MVQSTHLDLGQTMIQIFLRPFQDKEEESITSLTAQIKYVQWTQSVSLTIIVCVGVCMQDLSACTMAKEGVYYVKSAYNNNKQLNLNIRIDNCILSLVIRPSLSDMASVPYPVLYLSLSLSFQIPESFADCLGGLLSVVGQNLALKIEAVGETSLPAVHANRPVHWSTPDKWYVHHTGKSTEQHNI